MTLRRDVDTTVLLLAVTLTCIGVVMVYSSSAIMAAERFNDGFYFLKRQLVYTIVGFLLMAIATYFNYQNWRKLSVITLIGSIFLLALLFVPGLGVRVGGALRWLRLPGFNLQPAELVKLGLVLYLAHSLTRKKEMVRSFAKGYLPYMIVLGVLLLLLLKQPDLGSAMIIAGVALSMLIVAGVRWFYVLATVAASMPALYFLVMNVEYRRRRIMAFIDPWDDPFDTGFQIIQSLVAFGNGGVFGQGLGTGQQKLFYLPEAHTDFIFSVIGEELGLVGAIVVAALFLMLVLCGIRIALQCEDPFGRNLAFGLSLLLGLEAFVNLAVCMGLLPTKGLALPFISYGGTSLVVCLVAVGILLNISSKEKAKR
ncbi:cell division-specific peptidoglycan biosynthesis regulator FtsW [Malonomonas rubra DSM 5091]|uniref:Probable peptidoglycan glycosyltransferase FtsW n=1 Tax=Malonomonas rubra DSM 5091 TaxID=1122189 RepID=A0A1M6E5M1_MALRU|nr:putative lipid II flippase FtsW [Malonomonas rubra]SHI80844.1 cell division-specific peptidoglycan biosynthesis regulator FtsW [Malonomonas rubra DSM 5091]